MCYLKYSALQILTIKPRIRKNVAIAHITRFAKDNQWSVAVAVVSRSGQSQFLHTWNLELEIWNFYPSFSKSGRNSLVRS